MGESIIGFRRFNKFTDIYSFEPNPNIYKKLTSRFKNKKNIFLNKALLMSENNTTNFYVPIISKISMPYLGSFNKELIIQRLDHFFSVKNKIIEFETFEIKARKLDDYNLSPKILKIDAEGSELEVLKGSKETIRRSQPLIIVEFNHNNYKEIYKFLSKKGYELFKFLNKNLFHMEYDELLIFENFKNQRNLIFKTKSFYIWVYNGL